MTEKLHALTTQGMLTEVGHGHPLTLKFTTPKNCKNAWVEVHARNHWTVSNKAKLPKDKEYLRAIIYGKLVGGKFIRTKIAQYYDIVVPGNHTQTFVMYDDAEPPKAQVIPGSGVTPLGAVGEIHYLIIEHDGTESRVPLQRYEPDKELAPFEIIIEVFADLGGDLAIQRLPAVQVKKLYTKRASVAFIAARQHDFATELGTPTFPVHAEAYWKRQSDNEVVKQPYLAEILKTIATLDTKRRNDQPLDTLNIVSHGTQATWWIRDSAEVDPITGDINGFSARRLNQRTFPHTPPESVLDSASTVVVRACELGNDKALLDAIRKKFNNKPTVYAPRYELVYQTKDGRPLEILAQIWRFSVPGDKAYPSDSQIASYLESTYAPDTNDEAPLKRVKELYARFTTSDWVEVGKIKGTSPDGPSVRFPRQVEKIPNSADGLDPGDVLDADGNQDDAKIKRQLWPNPIPAYELTVTKFVKVSGKYNVGGNATRTKFKLLRLLTKDHRGTGDLVTPDFKDPLQFGKSP